MKRLSKPALVIWSDYDPGREDVDLEDLGREAMAGDAYCSSRITVRVDDPELDPDWDDNEFFGRDVEDEDDFDPNGRTPELDED